MKCCIKSCKNQATHYFDLVEVDADNYAWCTTHIDFYWPRLDAPVRENMKPFHAGLGETYKDKVSTSWFDNLPDII